MDFPIVDLMDADACYAFLVETLHPEGLRCPTCGRADAMAIHDRHRPPVFDYRCRNCTAVFNAYTGTVLQKTHRSPVQLVLILRGIWQGTPTAQLARELECDRKHLLALRHKLQELAANAAARTGPVCGSPTEADEMFQNAGEKRSPASGSGRSSATPSQQTSGSRHIRQRSPAGSRSGQSANG